MEEAAVSTFTYSKTPTQLLQEIKKHPLCKCCVVDQSLEKPLEQLKRQGLVVFDAKSSHWRAK